MSGDSMPGGIMSGDIMPEPDGMSGGRQRLARHRALGCKGHSAVSHASSSDISFTWNPGGHTEAGVEGTGNHAGYNFVKLPKHGIPLSTTFTAFFHVKIATQLLHTAFCM